MTYRLLLDTSSLMYRAFFALPPSIADQSGQPINAVLLGRFWQELSDCATIEGSIRRLVPLDALMKRIKEAIELCLEVEEPFANEFIGVQRVAITA